MPCTPEHLIKRDGSIKDFDPSKIQKAIEKAGKATGDVHFNPNGSAFAVEGICSPDGRVFGKMGHAERIGSGLYKNVPGAYDMHMFSAAVEYFK